MGRDLGGLGCVWLAWPGAGVPGGHASGVLITPQAVLGAGDFVYFLNVPATVAVRCLGGGNADETRQTRSRAGSRPMTGCRERAKPGELYRSGLLVALRALVIRLQPRAPNLQSHQPILASSSRASTSSLLLAVHSSALLLKKKSPAAKLGLGSWHDAGGLAGPMVASAMTAVTTARLLAVWALCAGLLSHIRLQWPYSTYMLPSTIRPCRPQRMSHVSLVRALGALSTFLGLVFWDLGSVVSLCWSGDQLPAKP